MSGGSEAQRGTAALDFLSLAAHELRSPATAVNAAALALQERWEELDAEQRASLLSVIVKEAGRLASLVGDVLDASRIEAGAFSYSFADVDVAELVEEMVAAAAPGRDDVTLTARVEPLPRVRGDRRRLKQVLANLLENALEHSRAGDDVEVRAWAEDGSVRVAVRDRGPGLPREHQELVFEKFGRAGDGTRPGSGLGLFIARAIAEAHGGSLEVESAPGRGATFTLSLPT